MKTSYKIITVYVISILAVLFVTNISLKAKYKNGDFDIPEQRKEDVFATYDLDKKELANFKYVVVNGGILTKNGKQIKFNPNISISSGNKENVLGLQKNLSSLLRKRISNDTLYISFQKNYVNEENLKRRYFQEIILQAKDLRAVSVKNLDCKITSILSGKPFTVNTEESNVTIGYIKTNLLTLNIGKQSDINFVGYGIIKEITHTPPKVDQLNYNLTQGSSISIANKELIGKINCLTPSKDIIEGDSKSLIIQNPRSIVDKHQ